DRDRAVIVPSEAKDDLIKEFNKAGVQLDVKEPDKSSFWFSMISSFFLPILLLVGFLFMFRSAQSGGNQAMSFGRSRAKLMVDNKVKVTGIVNVTFHGVHAATVPWSILPLGFYAFGMS